MDITLLGPFSRPDINPFTLPDHPFNRRDGSPSIQTELDAYEAQNAVARGSVGERGASSSLFNPAETLLHVDESSRRMEKTISELCSRGSPHAWEAAQRLFWNESAYSPQRLTEELGWEPPFPNLNPDPRKARSRAAPSLSRDNSAAAAATPLCTWYDAFEDLARISSGLPMRDPRELAAESEPGRKWAGHELSENLSPWLQWSGYERGNHHTTVREIMKISNSYARLNIMGSIYSYLPFGHDQQGGSGGGDGGFYDQGFTPRNIEEWKRQRLNRRLSGTEREAEVRLALEMNSFETAFWRFSQAASLDTEERDMGFTHDASGEKKPPRRGGWAELRRSFGLPETESAEGGEGLDPGRPEDGVEKIQGGIVAKEVNMPTPEVSEEVLEGGVVKKTVKSEIRDDSGKVIGSNINTSWTDREGQVVKVENFTEVSTADANGNISSSSSKTEERSWSWSWSSADGKKSDAKDEEEGQTKESGSSKYRKWSLWK
ncbi:hypothetical protein QBC42DRAFT_279115 [Cladorrhinum samala]|uniref:Uncharacterized protein n=1 Tax=Cladorrhinum samala TaxID=585594 RepID=A0AAV9HEC9_9PEZI|nr:hypothetical protein QBC42DRAFT_279115 [Cladorrhinum samala]